MDKKEKRKKQIVLLKQFANLPDKKSEDQILAQKFLELDEVKNAKTIGMFFSMEYEINTMPIIEELCARGKKLYLPKVVPGPARKMNFIRYTVESKFEISSFGVKEIADSEEINNNLDLLLVPGIAFSEKGHFRLGYGGGYYDRFLEQYPDCITVSLANSQMLVEKADWPIEEYDIPIEVLISVN